MGELDVSPAETMAALRQAQPAIDRELRAMEAARFLDRDSLAQIEEAARRFEEQADSLGEMMASQGAAQELLDEVEDLFDFFRQVEERAEAIIEANRESG